MNYGLENMTKEEGHKIAKQLVKESKMLVPPTLTEVKTSVFGCINCLWNCVECNHANKFSPEWTKDGVGTCKAYAYFD